MLQILEANVDLPRFSSIPRLGLMNHQIISYNIIRCNWTLKALNVLFLYQDGNEGTAKSGDVLVETEPIYYDLTRVKLNWPKKRVVKQTPHILGEASIANNGQEAANMAKAFGYTYKYLVYWGQGHAMLKGLNTSVTLTNGTVLPKIMWGLVETSNRTDVYTWVPTTCKGWSTRSSFL